MYIVYIAEAHPLDGWALSFEGQPAHFQHKSMQERLEVAEEFKESIKTTTTATILVDDFTNPNENFFNALPGNSLKL